MKLLSSLKAKARERFEERGRTGDITPLSIAVCLAILLIALINAYRGT